jgi:Mn-dependent DtxR family transcriptional regulator
MRLQDIFKTPTMAKVLDLLLANPGLCYMQGDLKRRLNVDKATLRVTLARLQRLGLVVVDVPGGVGIKAITFNGDSDAGRAFLSLHRKIRKI